MVKKSKKKDVPEGFKRCSKCGDVKPVGEFYVKNKKTGLLRTSCKECEKEYDRERSQKPERKEYMREYRQKPERKEYTREYNQKPERKERERERSQKPERKEHVREYNQKPERKESNQKYNQKPERKEYMRERNRDKVDSLTDGYVAYTLGIKLSEKQELEECLKLHDAPITIDGLISLKRKQLQETRRERDGERFEKNTTRKHDDAVGCGEDEGSKDPDRYGKNA